MIWEDVGWISIIPVDYTDEIPDVLSIEQSGKVFAGNFLEKDTQLKS